MRFFSPLSSSSAVVSTLSFFSSHLRSLFFVEIVAVPAPEQCGPDYGSGELHVYFPRVQLRQTLAYPFDPIHRSICEQRFSFFPSHEVPYDQPLIFVEFVEIVLSPDPLA